MVPRPVSAGAGRLRIISALGVMQILAWGSSFYLLSVLAEPIAADTGWPLTWIVGGLSVGLMVAGLASPLVGQVISRHGGRPVLAASSVLIAAGLVMLGLAPELPVFIAGWVLLGLGMAAGLYDPAFATLGGLYGANARSAITTLTLWGGFASTVSWPLSALLLEHVGWRSTCFIYAGIQLAVCLPLALAMIPAPPARQSQSEKGQLERTPEPPRERRAFWLMAGILTLGGTIMTMVSVHLLTLLQARDIALASAVTFGALIGPSQVAARILEMAGKGRYHPLWTLTAAMALVAVGVVMLALGLPVIALALVLYGAGNGIYSISRGTVPLALFGPERFAVLVGRLARPALMAQAAAPLLGAFILTHRGAEALYAMLTALALANCGLVVLLWRVR